MKTQNLFQWIINLYRERKGRKVVLSRMINRIVQERIPFDSSFELLHINHASFVQNIQNGEREITIDVSYCKAKLIWNDNGKNLIYYTINIY